MAYIGNTQQNQNYVPAIDYFSGNGSTTAFTLSRPVASVAQVQAVIENVPQNPGDAYTVSGNTITFTSAPPSGTNNIYVYYTSPNTQVVALPQSPIVYGNLNFGSTGARIQGDFTNATVANRVAFQTSTTNGNTGIFALPNGSGTTGAFQAYNNSDPTNSAYCGVDCDTVSSNIRAAIRGTGTYLPMTFFTSGTERMRIDTSGNVGIGTSSPSHKLQVNNTGGAGVAGYFYASDQSQSRIAIQNTNGQIWHLIAGTAGVNNSGLGFYDATAAATRMQIDSSGNVGIGITSFGTIAPLTVATASVNPNYGQITAYSITSGDVARTGMSVVKYDNNTTTSQILFKFLINQGANGSGQINANGANSCAFGTYSDARLKENITSLPNQLDNILALKPCEFDYIESEGGGHQIGFIAQEMQEVYPDAVGERSDGMLTISGWDKTTARLVKAIQELKAIVDEQAEKIKALEAR